MIELVHFSGISNCTNSIFINPKTVNYVQTLHEANKFFIFLRDQEKLLFYIENIHDIISHTDDPDEIALHETLCNIIDNHQKIDAERSNS